MSRQVPSLDLNDYLSNDPVVKQKFSDDLYNSFKEYGFVVLKNHGVSSKTLEKAYEVQKKFFALPVEEKMKLFLNNGGARGYTPLGTERAASKDPKKINPVDHKSFFHVGRENWEDGTDEKVYPKNVWPESMPEMKTTFVNIFDALEKVGDLILKALEKNLEVEDGFFKKRTSQGNSVLRLLHYPPLPEGLDPQIFYARSHSDINCLTALVVAKNEDQTKSGPQKSGLEVWDRSVNEWLPVLVEEDNLILNVGDMLQRITNNDEAGGPGLSSTKHQVVNPENKNTNRYSMPFFLHFRDEVPLECLPKFKADGEKYPLVTAGEYLDERLKEIGLKK